MTSLTVLLQLKSLIKLFGKLAVNLDLSTYHLAITTILACFGIPQAAEEVIHAVAKSQADRLETDAQKQFEEITREFALRNMEFDGRYLEVMNQIRGRLIDDEIAERIRAGLVVERLQQEEETMILLMLAAAVA